MCMYFEICAIVAKAMLKRSPKINLFVRKPHFPTTSIYFIVASKRGAANFKYATTGKA